MNYYRRYVGDFQKKTMRLDPTDVGCYDLMLDYYYAEEQPLPLDLDDIYAICKAIKPEHRRSVSKVLSIYFERREDGYHNKRADEEIAVAQRARANGKAGGRPPGDGTQTGTQIRTQTGTEDITETITHTATQTVTGSVHPPTTNHQPPSFNHQPSTSNPQERARATRARRAPRKTPLPADFTLSERVISWAAENEVSHLDKHFESFVGRAKAKGYTYADWDAALMNAIRDDWAKLGNGAKTDQAVREWLAGGNVIDGEATRG